MIHFQLVSKELSVQLNNKGQSLVIFIIIIPILLGIMALVIDIGNLIYTKQELDNINKIVLNYGISNITEENVIEEMTELAKLNNDKITTQIKFEDEIFYIETTYYVKGIFTNIFDIKGYLATSTYKGYLDSNDKQIIEKIK